MFVLLISGDDLEEVDFPFELKTFSELLGDEESGGVLLRCSSARLSSIEIPFDVAILAERRMSFETILVRTIFADQPTIEETLSDTF